MGRVYSNRKIFHFQGKLDSLPRENPAILAPIHVRIKPTNACNHRCSYCAYRDPDLQLGRDMRLGDAIPRDKMMEILDDLVAMGVRAVTFSGGGDPFCYPHLLEAARRLASSPIKFAALTNGSRLEGELAEIFAHEATWLRISIDGWDGPSYARYRDVGQDEFDRVMANLAAFKSHDGPCLLGGSIVVDHENADHVYALAQRLKEAGVDSVKISHCIVSNDGGENHRYHAAIFDRVREQVDRVAAELADASFELFDCYHEVAETFTKDYSWCPYLQILPVIGADLEVYACQDKAYNRAEGSLGSIRNHSFRDFWSTDKEKFFRVDPRVHCPHHCAGDGKNRLVLEYLACDPGHLEFV